MSEPGTPCQSVSLAGLPPGPALSRERQTARMAMRPLAFMQELREEHGDVFTVHVRHEAPWAMVSDPELIRQVFRARAETLHAGEGKRVLHPVVGDNSLLLLDEGRYTEQRKLLLPPFSRSSVETYVEAMRAAAARTITEWPVGRPTAAALWTRAIALEAILHAVFGVGGSARLDPLRAALSDLRLPGNVEEGHSAALECSVALIDELIYGEIEERAYAAEDGGHGDVLSLLLQASHEDGSPMSRTEIRDELMSLLLAGHETTATTLAWALERLAREPEALARVESEADQGGGAYTDAVLKETLRIRPALPLVARAVKQPFELGAYTIPVGATIVPAILLLHHRADIHPEPASFRPERFLDRQPDPLTWIPFGGGARRCLGARFAMLEMRIVLSTLLAQRTLRPAEPGAEAMRRREVMLSPARGAQVILEAR